MQRKKNDKIDTINTQPEPTDTTVVNPDLAALNENWQGRLLNGDVLGVLDEFTTMKSEAEKNISTKNANKVNQLVGGLKEEPFFDTIKDTVLQEAFKYVNNGKDAETAVELAYNKISRNYLGGIVATVQQSNPDALQVAVGGSKREPASSTSGKLTPGHKAAAARDIAAKVFKDEAEYIKHLSPAIRKQMGV